MTSDAVPGTSEPFDPADVTWTPVSRRLIGARLTVTAIWLTPVLLLTVLLAVLVGEAWLWVFPALVVVLGAWIAWVVRRQVGAIAYAERADDLLVRRGIVFRSLVVVPYGRMQYVDVNAGPLARRFGIASVQLHTASPATSASIDGLPPREAARLRDRMASRGEARLAGL
ncbi:PH domain-containing protein [Cellulomonas fengjieae]|uniref:PH domain-containing protein n=1 Tax=Cellulomonas fengjieae TaxID=2819978 RepID=UPI001AAF4531|nr:PH domain-containing protein [Cellulomonas fengjieae]MBO3100791.1 PH domain-containing protein [Cellulomonas fengjieae]